MDIIVSHTENLFQKKTRIQIPKMKYENLRMHHNSLSVVPGDC